MTSKYIDEESKFGGRKCTKFVFDVNFKLLDHRFDMQDFVV